MIRVFLMEAVGNLALFALGYYWLALPTSSIGNVILSVALVVLMMAMAAYLIAFAFNRDARASVRRIPALLTWLGISGAVWAGFAYLLSFAPAIDLWIDSALTFATRIPVQIPYISRGVLLIGLLILALRLLLPVAARAANYGADGLRDWRPVPLSLRYIAAVIAWVLIGLWIPWRLFWWIPTITSFAGQMASFVLRAGVAFALFTGGWLLFAGYCRAKTATPKR